MPHAEIPEIRDIPGTVSRFIDRPVEVYRTHTMEGFGDVQTSSTEDTNHMIDEILEALGVPRNRELSALCAVVSRVAVKRLVSQPNLSIAFGRFGEAPVEVIDVTLRPEESQVRQADVRREE